MNDNVKEYKSLKVDKFVWGERLETERWYILSRIKKNMVIWIPTKQVQYGIKSSKWHKICLGLV